MTPARRGLTTYRIISATETDVVSLGATRDEVREALGEFRTFRRTPGSEEADQFTDCGAMATYSSDGVLTLLELADPARVELEGVQLLGEELDVVGRRLEAKGLRLEPGDAGASIPSLSAGLYAPSGQVEGFSLGSD